MTDQWQYGQGTQDPPASSDAGSRNTRWLRRPRRSTGDRKIAGVAGGLGRAFGIDPVLIRVAFVVLTIFGGFGGLLYVLGWLLLPCDGDEVSAAEALLGRGRSSVPPPLAVGLAVAAVVSVLSMFSWGLPFLPLAIGGVVLLTVMRRRGRPGHRYHQHHRHTSGGGFNRPGWAGPGGPNADWSEQAEHWASSVRSAARSARDGRGPWGCGSRGQRGSWGSGWSSGSSRDGNGPAGTSPFEQPAFWEQPAAGRRAESPTPPDSWRGGVNMNKSPAAAGSPDEVGFRGPGSSPAETGRTTPPAWDPLGVAPFAWDLPEPTPVPEPLSRRAGGGVIARVGLGATLLVGAVSAIGVLAGWWVLAWAQVSAIALGVLALALLFSAVRGRGYSLIGPGVFLSVVTLALAVTGISGTSGYGATQIHPTSYTDLLPSYVSNAGDLELNLTDITIPKNTTKNVTVELKGGHASVVVPAGMNVTASCSAELGRADCLGRTAEGVTNQSVGSQPGDAGSGTLDISVKVNAGFAEVSTSG